VPRAKHDQPNVEMQKLNRVRADASATLTADRNRRRPFDPNSSISPFGIDCQAVDNAPPAK